jgi:membrane dipeptidase
MQLSFKKIILAAMATHLLVACGETVDPIQHAVELDQTLMTLDTHVDIPLNYATSEVQPHDGELQVNLKNMRSGGLDAAFFIVYTGQTDRTPAGYATARADAEAKFAAIHRMTDILNSDEIGLATTAAKARELNSAGKLVAFIGIENGFVIGKDLGLLEHYRDLGARYMTLVHNGHNDIGDSAQPQERLGDQPEEHGGLSEFGRQVIPELNRLGIVVDISHVSRKTMLQATQLSAAPVIASHSAVRAINDHPRNMDDEQMLALRDNGGVLQVVAYDSYLKAGGGSTVIDFVDHIDYAVDLIGIDHVGISSDFGGGGGITGWQNAGETKNVTEELIRRNYTDEEIVKLWSANTLRILEEAEKVATYP